MKKHDRPNFKNYLSLPLLSSRNFQRGVKGMSGYQALSVSVYNLWLLLNTCSRTLSFANENNNLLNELENWTTALKCNCAYSKCLEKNCSHQTIAIEFTHNHAIGTNNSENKR